MGSKNDQGHVESDVTKLNNINIFVCPTAVSCLPLLSKQAILQATQRAPFSAGVSECCETDLKSDGFVRGVSFVHVCKFANFLRKS